MAPGSPPSKRLRPSPAYVDRKTGKTYTIDKPIWCGENHAPLMITDLPGITKDQIDKRTRSIWRYAKSLPLDCPEAARITLGEGCTPLVKRRLRDMDVLIKCEWFMPTGSFKDRGSSVMLSLLRQQGVTDVLEDSSGNGGASVSCYAAAGGLTATIMAPESTSPAKTTQMRAHGATVELIPGPRQATADAAVAAHGKKSISADGATVFYASHAWHPFFLQGTKTLAYELWEDLDFTVPDNVVMPCGGGSNVMGCEIGFAELRRAGEITTTPRLFAAQPSNCGPIAASFLSGLDGVAEDFQATPTIAEGTAISKPVRLTEVVAALKATGGGAVLLSEEAIGAAMLELARTGIYVEPTCAQALAAYWELLRVGTIKAEEKTVLVLTGTGIKATPRIAELIGQKL